MRVKCFILFSLIFNIFSFLSAGDTELSKKAPDFTLNDSNGKKHNLSDYRGKYVVLEWINFDCPFVRKYYGSGNMQALINLISL